MSVMTIASFRGLSWVLRSHNLSIVPSDLGFHIWHASVGYLDSMPIDVFMEWVGSWEALIYDLEEPCTYIGLDVEGVWGVAPNYVSVSLSLRFGLGVWGIIC